MEGVDFTCNKVWKVLFKCLDVKNHGDLGGEQLRKELVIMILVAIGYLAGVRNSTTETRVKDRQEKPFWGSEGCGHSLFGLHLL